MGGSATTTNETSLLREVRVKLLHLHQTLLNVERKSFEHIHGSVTSGELLQLVINHPQFAWLRTISALITEIDEMFDSEDAPAGKDVTNLIRQSRQLFTSAENEEFRSKYQTMLQQEPEVVMEHSALMKLLRPKA